MTKGGGGECGGGWLEWRRGHGKQAAAAIDFSRGV